MIIRKCFSILKNGIIKGLKTVIMLLKVMIPIYLLVVVLKYSPVMDWFSSILAPLMSIFNLPPEASVAIITGIFTDEYGVAAAISSFDFSSGAITTICMICLMAHSLPVESALAKKIGYPTGTVMVFRIAMAIFTGIIVGWSVALW